METLQHKKLHKNTEIQELDFIWITEVINDLF